MYGVTRCVDRSAFAWAPVVQIRKSTRRNRRTSPDELFGLPHGSEPRFGAGEHCGGHYDLVREPVARGADDPPRDVTVIHCRGSRRSAGRHW